MSRNVQILTPGPDWGSSIQETLDGFQHGMANENIDSGYHLLATSHRH